MISICYSLHAIRKDWVAKLFYFNFFFLRKKKEWTIWSPTLYLGYIKKAFFTLFKIVTWFWEGQTILDEIRSLGRYIVKWPNRLSSYFCLQEWEKNKDVWRPWDQMGCWYHRDEQRGTIHPPLAPHAAFLFLIYLYTFALVRNLSGCRGCLLFDFSLFVFLAYGGTSQG